MLPGAPNTMLSLIDGCRIAEGEVISLMSCWFSCWVTASRVFAASPAAVTFKGPLTLLMCVTTCSNLPMFRDDEFVDVDAWGDGSGGLLR